MMRAMTLENEPDATKGSELDKPATDEPTTEPEPDSEPEHVGLSADTAAALGLPPMIPGGAPRTVTVEHHERGPGLLIRTLWYIFIGWWLSGVVSLAAWVIGLTVIGLPLTFWVFNRIPTLLTLRPRRTSTTTTIDEAGNIHIRHVDHPQPAFWKRAVYFILIGWWFSLVWIVTAWVLSVLIVTIPLAVMMQNRLPAVTTLHRY
jgi:uncharacterized membrane protein YccF (DUF307 family)